MKTLYFNEDGENIVQMQWLANGASAGKMVREYENDYLRIELWHHYKVMVDPGSLVEHAHIAEIKCYSRVTTDFEGNTIEPKWVQALDLNQSFRTHAGALRQYEEILTEMGYAVKTDGGLVEHGNKRSPDLPTVVEGSPAADSFGAW